MDRKKYLANRFRRDFLQYSLLQDDSLSAKELAEKLYAAVDLNELITGSKQEIESLYNKHLSIDKVKVEGKLSNELPEELGYNLKDKIIAEYKVYMNSLSTSEITNAVTAQIVSSVERLTWGNGIVNMQDAIRLLIEKLNNSSRSYGNLYTTPISEKDILDKFNKAKENTLLERIKGDNIDDIIEYRSTLIEYVRVSCENMLHAKLKDIYSSIANDGDIEQLISHFGNLSILAQELKASIVDCEANEEWDKQYNRLVPTDFYRRNVESITAEHAFQMILLQFFAQNEEWMIEKGMLSSGELRVYTSKDYLLLKELMNTIENALI